MNTINPDLQSQVNDTALLNVLMYIKDDVNPQNSWTVNDILVELGDIYGAEGGYERYIEKHPSGCQSDYEDRQRQYQILNNASNENANFSNLRIGNQSNIMDNPSYESGGLNAATFTDETGKVMVVYRGTGAGEWPDNGTGLGGMVDYTEQQKEAKEYFDRVVEENGWNESKPIIDITGHSKGGNKEQFVVMTSEYSYLIRNGFSFDGQGMSPEAVEWMKATLGDEEFNSRRDKLYSISADNDYVNILGERLVPKKHIIYLESELTGKGWHYPDSYLRLDGKLTNETEQGDISKYLESISQNVMILPSPIRNVLTEGAMGFAQMGLGDGAIVNGGELSWAEMLGSIPLLIQMIPGSTIDYLGDKYGVNLEWLSNLVTGVVVLYGTPFTALMYGIGTTIDIVMDVIEKIKLFGQKAKELTLKVIDYFENAINNLQNWWNKNFNTGYKYATANPVIRLDTYKLQNYADRLRNINKRLNNLDRRMDSLYWNAGFSDLLTLMQADLLTGESWRIKKCILYLEDTADDFKAVEQKIISQL